MKKIILFALILIANLSAQQDVLSDTVTTMKEELIGQVFYNPIDEKLYFRNMDGSTVQTLELSQYYTSRTEHQNLSELVDQLYNIYEDPITIDTTGWMILYPSHVKNLKTNDVILYVGAEAIGGEFGWYNLNIDYVIKQSQFYAWLLKQLDTLNARIGGQPALPTPTYAFYYSPVNFGNNVKSDTTMRRYIKNSGTAVLNASNISWVSTNVGELYPNPFSITSATLDSISFIAAGDSDEVDIRFQTALAQNSYLYEWTAIVTHNGSTSPDSFFVQGSYVPNVIIDPVDTANFYVSTSGDDDCVVCNTREAPLKTIAKALELADAGDVIALKAGDTFNENITIVKDSVTIISYGTGAKPIITSIYAIPGTATPGNWSLYSTNIWRFRNAAGITSSTGILRLMTDANGTDLGAKAYSISGDGDSSLNSTNNWIIKWGDDDIYVYSTSNPATQLYVSNDYTIRPYTIEMNGVDKITLDGLDIRGGYITIAGKYCDNLVIKNCNIGLGTDRYGINLQWCESGTLSNDTIDAGWKVKFKYDAETIIGLDASDAFSLGGGSNWEIHDNYFANWYHAGILLVGKIENGYADKIVANNNIYDNYFTTENMYMRAFGMVTQDLTDNYDATNTNKLNRIYRNRMTNLPTQSQIAGDSNYIYYNIFDSTFAQPYGRAGIATHLVLQAPYDGGVARHNWVFNNTFYLADIEVYTQSGENIFMNNLFVNCGQAYSVPSKGRGFEITSGSRDTVKNNFVYSEGNNSSSLLYSYYGLGKTPSQFNALNGTNNHVITGNLALHTGILSSVINSDFTIPVGSPALNASVNIDYLLPGGFTDLKGNTVNQTAPNIGCIDN